MAALSTQILPENHGDHRDYFQLFEGPITKRHDREYFDKYVRKDPISSKTIHSITVQEWDEFFKSITSGRRML